MPLDMDERDSFRRSVLVHQLAGGRGCALLYEHDDSAPAMLLERLGRNLSELDLPLPRLLETIATTLGTFWRPVADDCGLPSAVDKARWLANYITSSWDELGRPCSTKVVDRALAYCDERAAAFDPSQAILVHGDAHGWNTVEAGAGTFTFVLSEERMSRRSSLSRWRRAPGTCCRRRGPALLPPHRPSSRFRRSTALASRER
jgi:hypothetical protein